MAAAAVFLRELFLCTALFFLLRRLLAGRRKLPPGPSGFPVVGALPLLGAAPHVSLARMAKRYGPVMHLKMGQYDVVVASTPAAACVFLKTLDHAFADRPLAAAATRLAYGAQDLVFAGYGPRWKFLRKLCNLEMLGTRALDAWAAVRRDEAGRMLRAMQAAGAAGEKVPLGSTLIYTMANMIGRVILSRRVFETKGSEANEFKDMVMELMTLAGLINVGDFVPAVAWMDLQGLEARMKNLHKRFNVVLARMVAEHTASRGEREQSGRLDLLDAVMAAASGEGEQLSEDNVKALLLNLFTAGTDTSTGTIEWAMAEMLLNPAILRRAQEEMDRVVGRSRRLEEADIPNLPYLQAICKESFRKHPSTPLNLPRVATQPCEVGGYYIPKNTRLLVNIWAIGRDPEVWAEPLEFDPGRFATAEGAKIDPRSGNDFELIPFGAGRRICAGARMGVVLVQYLLGSLIHAFDWEMPPGEKMDMGETFGIALQKSVPVEALVTPRLDPRAYD